MTIQVKAIEQYLIPVLINVLYKVVNGLNLGVSVVCLRGLSL